MILARSLDGNNLTNSGKDMSAVLKLAKVLPQTKVQSLRCLSAKCRRSMSMLARGNMHFSCTRSRSPLNPLHSADTTSLAFC